MKHAACIKNYCYGVGERKGEIFRQIRLSEAFIYLFFKTRHCPHNAATALLEVEKGGSS